MPWLDALQWLAVVWTGLAALMAGCGLWQNKGDEIDFVLHILLGSFAAYMCILLTLSLI